MTRDQGRRRATRAAAAGLLLVALTVAAYAPVAGAGFIWDDDAYVTDNAALRTLGGLGRIWFEPGAVPQYYPLTFTSFWVEYQLWGARPLGYHLVNVCVHAANALLLWLVLRRLRVGGAWMAAAIFALHPMMVESVAWITERKNVLSGFWALAALLVYLRAAGGAAAGRRLRWPASLAVCALFAAALLSKTVTCSLPAVLLLIVWWRRGALDRRTLALLAPLFAAGLGMALVTVWMERHHVGAAGDEWALSLGERLLVAGRALWFYPRTLLWPRRLTFIYPRWTVDAAVWWQYLFPAAALLVLVLLYAARRRIGRGPLAAALCYAGTLAPALGFINVYPMRYSFVADHFAYLPSIALIVLATAGARAVAVALVRRRGRVARYAAYAAGAALLPALGLLTARQCGIYRDARALWTDTLAKHPECWMAHNNFGMLLAGEGNDEQAVAHYRQALRWKADFAEAYNNLGVLLASQGKTDEAAAQLQQAIRWRPDYAEAYSNLGNLLQGRGMIDAAIAQYAAALRLRPGYADAHYNLAVALAALGRTEDAVAHLEDLLRRTPDSPEAHNTLGNLLRGHGRLAQAGAHYAEALRVRPGFAEAHNNLGVALAMQGKTTEALAHFEQAIRAKPDYVEAHSNAGNVLQAQGQLDAAIARYAAALRLQPGNADTHNNLGLALLAHGKTADAIAHFEEALRLNPNSPEARDNLTRARRAQPAPERPAPATDQPTGAE